MLNYFLDWLFAQKRRALAAKLRRILAADRVMRTHKTPEPRPVFEGWRYLWAARYGEIKSFKAA